MQDDNEQNQQNEQPEPEAQAEAPAAEEQAEAPAADEPAEAPAAEEAPPEAPAEAVEILSPKQRRRQARSRTSGPAGPQREPEDRARERREARSRKAAERSRWRAHRRDKKKSAGSASGTGGQAQDGVVRDGDAREAGKRKIRQGVVVSNKGDKSITVRIDSVGRHRVYGRVIRSTGTLHAHDEQNQAAEGDVVRLVECRPLSRTKRWRLVEVLEKAR